MSNNFTDIISLPEWLGDDRENLSRETLDSMTQAIKQVHQNTIENKVEYVGGAGISVTDNGENKCIELNSVVDLEAVSAPEIVNDYDIPSALSTRNELDRRVEGFSTKYEVVEKGWHRVLNTIRGNAGQLYLTLTDGFTLQSLTIDMSGFVKIGSTAVEPEEAGYVFCKSQSSHLGPRKSTAQADPYFKYKITALRMGYASDEAVKTKFDPDVTTGVSINCYIDAYIDYNITTSENYKQAQLLTQFTGKSKQHNAYAITEETTSTNYKTVIGNSITAVGTQVSLDYGMYGEKLSFINIPIREDYDSVESGYNEKLVDSFKIKLEDDDVENRTAINEAHNITNISKITFDGISMVNKHANDLARFDLYRKYNILPLASTHANNDQFSSYIWENNAIVLNDSEKPTKFEDGNIVNPYRTGKKTAAGVHYNVTHSGTVIFDSNDTPSSNMYLNVYYSNSKANAILLPAGKYITNVYDVYLNDNPESSSSQVALKFSNYISKTPTIKGFILSTPTYLTFARLCLHTNQWDGLGGGTSTQELSDCLFAHTPFLMKVDDSVSFSGTVAKTAYTVTDERFNGFSVESSISSGQPSYEINKDGWLEITDENFDDFISINDTLNGETHIIRSFSEFYSSRRATGEAALFVGYEDTDYTYTGNVTEIDFNTSKILVDDESGDQHNGPHAVDSTLIQKYNMFVDKSENPYDTLFMFYKDSFVPVDGTIKHNKVVDIKELISNVENLVLSSDTEQFSEQLNSLQATVTALSDKVDTLPTTTESNNLIISQTAPPTDVEGTVWVKPLAQEIDPPANYIVEEGSTANGLSYRKYSNGSVEMWYSSHIPSEYNEELVAYVLYLDIPFSLASVNFSIGNGAFYDNTGAGLTSQYMVKAALAESDEQLKILIYGHEDSSSDSFFDVYIKGTLLSQ